VKPPAPPRDGPSIIRFTIWDKRVMRPNQDMVNVMLNVEEILKKLRELKPELTERYKVRDIGLFGSFARQEQRLDSDIDLLVEFGDEADLFDLIGLSLYLEEVFGCSVDVVPRKALREELREAVLQQVVTV